MKLKKKKKTMRAFMSILFADIHTNNIHEHG
jgi:hypothetical protein